MRPIATKPSRGFGDEPARRRPRSWSTPLDPHGNDAVDSDRCIETVNHSGTIGLTRIALGRTRADAASGSSPDPRPHHRHLVRAHRGPRARLDHPAEGTGSRQPEHHPGPGQRRVRARQGRLEPAQPRDAPQRRRVCPRHHGQDCQLGSSGFHVAHGASRPFFLSGVFGIPATFPPSVGG